MISQREMITRNYFLASKNMKSSIFLICIAFIFSLCSQAFAIDVPTGLRVSDSDSSSITIDWEAVPGAIWYYHYIGTESWTYVDGIDLIDGTEYTIWDLDTTKTYFISITSVDEFGTESEYAEEISYWAGINSLIISSGFRVSDVEILDPTTVEVAFSRNLNRDIGSTREFILEKKETWVETQIALSQVSESNSKNIVVVLDTPLETDTEYELVVLEIQDVEGNNIESGIDSFISFTSPKSFSTEDEESEEEIPILDSAWSTPVATTNNNTSENISETNNSTNNTNTTTNDSTSSSLNSENTAQNEEITTENSWNAGVTLSDEDVANTANTAEDNTSLPQTWPEHWLLVFLAMIIAGWFLYRFKK